MADKGKRTCTSLTFVCKCKPECLFPDPTVESGVLALVCYLQKYFHERQSALLHVLTPQGPVHGGTATRSNIPSVRP